MPLNRIRKSAREIFTGISNYLPVSANETRLAYDNGDVMVVPFSLGLVLSHVEEAERDTLNLQQISPEAL